MKSKTIQDKKMRTQLILAVALVVFGCVLITTAFFIPPMAEIHPSILTAFGEILTFAGAVIGVDYNYKKVVYKHDNEDVA